MIYNFTKLKKLISLPLMKIKKKIIHEKYVFFMDDCGQGTICTGKSDVNSILNDFSFALGGVIVPFENISKISADVETFREKWNIPPLHGVKIRGNRGKFSFLTDKKEKNKFLKELERLIHNSEVIVHACIICRPGYRDRYYGKFPNTSRWDMSKTAFDISVERATKFAMDHKRTLDVVYEKSGTRENANLETYFNDLKTKGTNFCSKNASNYKPLTASQFNGCLEKIWGDDKNNELLQLADLVLHPITDFTMGRKNIAYNFLKKEKMLIDDKHPDKNVAVKYSCYDGKYCKW